MKAVRKIFFGFGIIFIIVFLAISGCSLPSDGSDGSDGEKTKILELSNNYELYALISDIETIGLNDRHSLDGLGNFESMLDCLPDIDVLESENAMMDCISEYSRYFVVTERQDDDGALKKIVNLKVSPLLASVLNEDGEILINGKLWNFLDEDEAGKFVSEANYGNGSRWVWSTPDWMTALIAYPAGATTDPDHYPTKIIYTSIYGRSTIIELWKGYCPMVVGTGGVGVEVGLYQIKNNISTVFWPDFNYPRIQSWSLKHNGSTYISKTGKTWWLNGWRVYEQAPSLFGSHYTLYFTVGDYSGVW